MLQKQDGLAAAIAMILLGLRVPLFANGRYSLRSPLSTWRRSSTDGGRAGLTVRHAASLAGRTCRRSVTGDPGDAIAGGAAGSDADGCVARRGISGGTAGGGADGAGPYG
jgi:hypothetical protein